MPTSRFVLLRADEIFRSEFPPAPFDAKLPLGRFEEAVVEAQGDNIIRKLKPAESLLKRIIGIGRIEVRDYGYKVSDESVVGRSKPDDPIRLLRQDLISRTLRPMKPAGNSKRKFVLAQP